MSMRIGAEGPRDGDGVNHSTAVTAREGNDPGDAGKALRRNLAAAYRLASVALDDPTLAQAVVHDAAMTAWQVCSERPARDSEAEFRRTLEAGCRAMMDPKRDAVSGSADAPGPGSAEPLIGAIDALGPRDRYA